jgi:hypothetical protein
MKGKKTNMGGVDVKRKQAVRKLNNVKRRGWKQRKGLIKCGTNPHE